MTEFEVDSFVTYRRADGMLVGGQFAFVTELTAVEDDIEESDIIEERWILADRTVMPQVDPWAEFEVWEEEDEEDEPKVRRFRSGERKARDINHRRV